MAKKRTLIFIVGCPRSGTTLLLRMLNLHSRIQLAGESNFLMSIWGNRRLINAYQHLDSNLLPLRLQDFFDSNIQSFADEVHGFDYSPWINELEFRDWMNEFEHNNTKNYSNLYLSFMKVIARKRDKPIFGDKVTWYFRYVPSLLLLYPEAKIINVIRDGRAVVSSMLHRTISSAIPNNLVDMCLLWKRSTLLAKTYRKSISKRSYYEIMYENLIMYPEKEMRKLCDFLGIDFEKNMMNIKGSTNSAYKDVETKGLDETLQTKWKEKLDPAQIVLIEHIIGKELQNEGYERITTPNENISFDKKLEIIVRSVVYPTRQVIKENLTKIGIRSVHPAHACSKLIRMLCRK